jgi:hypothetical protein
VEIPMPIVLLEIGGIVLTASAAIARAVRR